MFKPTVVPLSAATAAAAPLSASELPLQHGRRLTLVASGADDVVEVRGVGGLLELRIRLTPEGPVLQMESVKLSLKAAQDVNVDCGSFAVHAREGLALRADGEVRVNGQMIHLN